MPGSLNNLLRSGLHIRARQTGVSPGKLLLSVVQTHARRPSGSLRSPLRSGCQVKAKTRPDNPQWLMRPSSELSQPKTLRRDEATLGDQALPWAEHPPCDRQLRAGGVSTNHHRQVTCNDSHPGIPSLDKSQCPQGLPTSIRTKGTARARHRLQEDGTGRREPPFPEPSRPGKTSPTKAKAVASERLSQNTVEPPCRCPW